MISNLNFQSQTCEYCEQDLYVVSCERMRRALSPVAVKRTTKLIQRLPQAEASFILNKEVMLKKISKRAISTGQLNDFHHLHIRPIKQIVFLSS